MSGPVAKWLETARVTNDPAGSLISVMRRNAAELPAQFRDVGHMRGWLRFHGAERADIEAVPEAWRRYSACCRHNKLEMVP